MKDRKNFFVRYRNEAGEEFRVFSSGAIFERPETPPDWLPLAVEGTYFDYWDDAIPTIQFDQAFFDAILRNFSFDVAHNTFCPVDQNHALPYGALSAEALAMIDELRLEGALGSRVLMGHVRYWTNDGAKKATGGGLPYISICPFHTPHPSTGLSPWLQSVALCASPYMRNIGPYLALTASGKGPQTQEEKKMKKLFALLGLGDNATEDQVVEKFQALQNCSTAYSAVLGKAGLADAKSADDIVAAFAAQAIKPLALAAGLPETASAVEIETKVKALALSVGSASELAKQVAQTEADVKKFKASQVIADAKGLILPDKMAEFSAQAHADPDKARQVLEYLKSFGVKLPDGPPAQKPGTPPDGQAFSAGAVELAKQFGRDEQFLIDNVKVRPN